MIIKTNFQIFVALLVVVTSQAGLAGLGGPRSVGPLVEPVETQLVVGAGQEFTLRWLVIDDDMASWVLNQNGSFLTSGQLLSSEVIYKGTEVAGFYLYNLIISDLSGNSANSSVSVRVEVFTDPAGTTTTPSSHVTSETQTQGDESAASGFPLLITLAFTTLALISRKKIRR